MIGKKVLSTSYVPMFEVKEILKARSEEGELTYEQNLASEYAKKLCRVSKSKGQKLLEELKEIPSKESPSVDEAFAVKIVDIMPESLERLKLLVPKTFKGTDEDLGKALELVKKQLK